jgi:hypothetical protein
MDPITDFIVLWSLNIAMLSGAFWVMLRFLEQLHKVWHLCDEDDE